MTPAPVEGPDLVRVNPWRLKDTLLAVMCTAGASGHVRSPVRTYWPPGRLRVSPQLTGITRSGKPGMMRLMKPASAAERVVAIDTVRGIALGGVLVVNLVDAFRGPLAGHILGMDEPLGPGGSVL